MFVAPEPEPAPVSVAPEPPAPAPATSFVDSLAVPDVPQPPASPEDGWASHDGSSYSGTPAPVAPVAPAAPFEPAALFEPAAPDANESIEDVAFDADPFGSLSELVEDDGTSSVMNFLRRD